MATRNLVGLVFNSQIPRASEFVESLASSLRIESASWTSSALDIGEKLDELARTSLIVTAGGDGTILRTLRVTAPFEIPIVGVNMGRVGFMTEVRVEDAVKRLPEYLNGNLRVEERMMLEASVRSGSSESPSITLHALNDVVVGQSGVARLLDVDTAVNGVPLTTYRADAVIVSTPTGSTGYALSAGGPILYPEARMMLIQPVAAHTGLRQGLVLPEESSVELRPGPGQKAILSADGFQDATLSEDDTVSVRRSKYVARFLRASPAASFYDSLTRRLAPVYRSRVTGEET